MVHDIFDRFGKTVVTIVIGKQRDSAILLAHVPLE